MWCDHRWVNDEQARVLARSGNLAVTQLDGRAFPGVHIQGDTFAELQRQFAEVVSRLRDAGDDSDALDDLQDGVEQMTGMLHFYETALEMHDIRRPYLRQQAD
jgi:hypothetical protein